VSGDPQTRYKPKYQLLNVEDDEKSKLVLTRDLPNKSKKNAWRFYLSTLLFTLGPHGVIRLCKPCRAPFTNTSLIARFILDWMENRFRCV
jgi:hypothetical protein